MWFSAFAFSIKFYELAPFSAAYSHVRRVPFDGVTGGICSFLPARCFGVDSARAKEQNT